MFNIIEPDENMPVEYGYVGANLIFNVQMDFTRKTRLVAGGHVTDSPEKSIYDGVVSR